MEQLMLDLFSHKIPYISKKFLNDELRDIILCQLDLSFYNNVLRQSINNLDTFCVVKGGAAVTSYLQVNKPRLTDIDIETYVPVRSLNENNILSFVPLTKLEKSLKSICEEQYDFVDTLLKNIHLSEIFPQFNNEEVIVFKSYVREAIQFSEVNFSLNKKQPFKRTISLINNDYYLVRYSFNVHMKSISEEPIKIYKLNNSTEYLDFFPLDLYFLDIIVKYAPNCYADKYKLVTLFDQVVYVEHINNVIADQIECLAFNVFNFNNKKVTKRISRIRALLKNSTEWKEFTVKQQNTYRIIIEDSEKFTLRDIKNILYCIGPMHGSRLLICLYFKNRFINNIKSVTYQVNFPFHKWQKDYYSVCWKRFLNILNDVFQLKFSIKMLNKMN
jgi:Protein of unknown function (DUF1383)